MTRAFYTQAAYKYRNSSELLLTPPTTDAGLAGEPEFGSYWDFDTRLFQSPLVIRRWPDTVSTEVSETNEAETPPRVLGSISNNASLRLRSSVVFLKKTVPFRFDEESF